MRIVLIGSGNLATNLGVALKNAGHQIVQVYSRTMEHAHELAIRLGAVPTHQIEQVSDNADVYILSLKDSVLQNILPTLCKGKSDKIFLHTAGSLPMDIFAGFAVHYGVFYPMQTFSKERLVDFKAIPCFIEACDAPTRDLLQALSRSITTKVYPLSSADRQYLHLAAVFSCNFVNHCYEISSELLAQHHISFSVMLPLIDETARKVHSLLPSDAQTGPAVRYDENVIERQKALLSDEPSWAHIYKQMTASIHQTATTKREPD